MARLGDWLAPSLAGAALIAGCSAGGGSVRQTSGSAGTTFEGGGGSGASAGAGGSGGAGGPSTPPPTEADACLRYVESWCLRTLRCGAGYGTFGQCLSNNSDLCPDAFFAVGSLRTVASMMECADVWETWPCSVDGAPPCAISGTLPNGDPCIGQAQCVGWCEGGTATQCGTCASRASNGEPCGSLCVIGSTCDASTNLCEPLGNIPSDPPPPGVGETCTGLCAAGARCEADPGGSGSVCVVLPPESERLAPDAVCDPDSVCQSGFECDCVSADCTERRCLAIQRVGEPCGDPGVVCHAAARCAGGRCVSNVQAGSYAQVCAGEL